MRRFCICVCMLFLLAVPSFAMDFTAPEPPGSAEALMPVETESFGQGLWEITRKALYGAMPDLAESALSCLAVFGVILLVGVLKGMPGNSSSVLELTGTATLAMLLLQQTNSMIHLSTQTVKEISEYGKLLVPVMTAAMAAQGGTVTSAALYTGTTVFNAVLASLIAKLLTPMVYVFLTLSVANSALGDGMIQKIRDFVKWLMTWTLKNILYIFTGYIGITKVISGTTDAATLKAAKLTISGMVPVVGGILSDASEAVIVSAGVMKNAVGVYGLLAVIALWIAPFLRIGLHYLLLKLTAAVCEIFDVKRLNGLVRDFSTTMGFLLGMTAAVCILLLIGIVCFMKGVG